jgi:hypothetical protein
MLLFYDVAFQSVTFQRHSLTTLNQSNGISCAYQDGFALHIPDYLLPETEAPMLAALTPPSERSYYTSLVLKKREEN